MADLPVTPLADYGSLLSSYPQAQSNIQTQQAQQGVMRAQVPLIGANTQIAQIAAQKAQMQLDFLKNTLQNPPRIPSPLEMQPPPGGYVDQSGTSSPSSGDPLQDEKNQMIGHAGQKYEPLVWNPGMQGQFNQLQMRDNLATAMGVPTNYAAQYKGQFDAENQKRQETAVNDYKMFTTAAEHGYDGMNRYEAQRALIPKLKAAGFTDEDVKDLATHMAPVAYQYSGLKSERQGGILVDKDSGQPVPGVDRLPMSIPDAEKQADELVKVTRHGAPTEMPHYEALGYSRGAYLNLLTSTGKEPPAKPGAPGAVHSSLPTTDRGSRLR